MLERDVKKRGSSLGEHFVAGHEVPVDVRAAAARVRHPGLHQEVSVDRHRPPKTDKDAGGHGGEAVPGGEEPARLVQRGRDEAAVDESGAGLVALVEAEVRLVSLGLLLGREREVDPCRVVAATPAGGVVVRRDPAQRNPPCWKCALKKFSEPAVAIAAEAEISSASVAAATICAKRYTLPGPAQPIRPSQERA
jgi:hypothetical protein